MRLNVCFNVSLSRESQKHGFKDASATYHAIGNYMNFYINILKHVLNTKEAYGDVDESWNVRALLCEKLREEDDMEELPGESLRANKLRI